MYIVKTTQQKVHSLGWCCLGAYFATKRLCKTKDIAETLEVDARTIRRLRARFREGLMNCPHGYSGYHLHYHVDDAPPIEIRKIRQRLDLENE